MNTKIIAAIVVVIIVIIGGYMVFGKSSSTPQTANTQTETTTDVSPTTAAMTAEASPAAMAANSVELTATGFTPATLTIKVGDTVTWTNKSGASATVNSDPHPVHTDFPPLNLGKFDDGQTLSLKFDKAGTHGYHNHFDPSQKGTIIVK